MATRRGLSSLLRSTTVFSAASNSPSPVRHAASGGYISSRAVDHAMHGGEGIYRGHGVFDSGSPIAAQGYDCLSLNPFKFSQQSMQAFPRWFCMKAQGEAASNQVDNICNMPDQFSGKETQSMISDSSPRVISFSPLEGTLKGRVSGLKSESLKIKRTELSQKITYALIPALLLVSKTKLTSSLIVLSVFWQIYGFFKEIFLDYVHQEVTRKWVLIYFRLLLLILAKDLFLAFDMDV